jgi:hypothetical protein
VALISLFLLLDTAAALSEIFLDLPLYSRSAVIREAEGALLGLLIGFALLRIVAAVGLWRGSRGAWILTMLLAGVGLVVGLAGWWQGEPNLLRLALHTVIAFYLNQHDVRRYFSGRETLPGTP